MDLSKERSVIVEAVDLVKDFGKTRAVAGVSFKVFKGECFGFLGPNGAGKTTTIKMIQCVSPLSSGTLYVAGMNVNDNPREIKKIVGIAPQENNLDPDFTVYKNLIVYSRYFDIPKNLASEKAIDLLDFFQLTEKKDVIIEHLSTGMKRRLILARALINEPKILILDEPTTGLDPQARHLIWDRIEALKKEGVTIILTTHYMDEATQLCDRIVIMDHGKIIEEGEPKQLIQKHVGKAVIEVSFSNEISAYLKKTLPNIDAEMIRDKIHFFTDEPERVFRNLQKFNPKEAIVRDANLEDVFLKLTGRSIRD